MKIDRDSIVTSIPCNDHAIFLSGMGRLHERLGIVLKWGKSDTPIQDDYQEEQVAFIDENGSVQSLDINFKNPVVAHRGETIPFEQLAGLYRYIHDTTIVIPDLKKYDVKIDKSNMTDTVVVYFDREYPFYPGYKVQVETAGNIIVLSPRSFCMFAFDKPSGNNGVFEGLIDEGGEHYDLRKLKNFLMEYSKVLGKKVKVEAYFRKSAEDVWKDRMIMNSSIYKDEKRYLGIIRTYLKERLDKDWNAYQTGISDQEAHKKEVEEWRKEAASEYDKNPELILG